MGRMSTSPRSILVIGGTGFVGRHLCEKLAQRQWHIDLPTRNEARARHLWPLPTLTVLRDDVHDDATLARLVQGQSAVVNLVGVLHGSKAAVEAAHVELPRRIAKACAAAGVKRLLHVSALGAAPDAPSLYQRSKAAGEQALQGDAALKPTILRPSIVFGPEDRFINLFAGLQQRFPVLPLARGGAKLQPVWVEDLAAALVACIADDATAGQTYEIAGPEVYTLAELVRLSARLSGHGDGKPILPLSDGLGALQALLMELAPGQPMLSRDNLASLKVDNVPGGQLPGLAELGIKPESLLAVAPSYLNLRGPRSQLIVARRTAGRF